MMRVISLGAGVQSSTMALMAKHGEIDMPDCAIFADTKAEPLAVYDWLDWLEGEIPFPVHRVTKGDLASESLRVRTSRHGNQYQQSAPPAWITEGNGDVNLLMRQCTQSHKIYPIRSKLIELGAKISGAEQFIGISLDEAHRMKPAKDAWLTNRWPLIEHRMSRHDCLMWMQRHGYPQPPRSSCYFCPYHSNQEWLHLQRTDPEAFQAAIEYENGLQQTMGSIKGFRGKPFLHRSCIPLSEIDFDKPSPQLDLFGNECEGMCGV